jgi:hypothetical protein
MNESESFELDVIARRNLLVGENLWMVGRAARWAKRRLPLTIEFDDLYQSAFLGLQEAAVHFDPALGVPFESYARKRVYGPPSIHSALGDHLKAAINDHFKTGQRSRGQDMKLFYRAGGSLGKLFVIFRLVSLPTSGRAYGVFAFLHRKVLFWFWRGRTREAPRGLRACALGW